MKYAAEEETHVLSTYVTVSAPLITISMYIRTLNTLVKLFFVFNRLVIVMGKTSSHLKKSKKSMVRNMSVFINTLQLFSTSAFISFLLFFFYFVSSETCFNRSSISNSSLLTLSMGTNDAVELDIRANRFHPALIQLTNSGCTIRHTFGTLFRAICEP